MGIILLVLESFKRNTNAFTQNTSLNLVQLTVNRVNFSEPSLKCTIVTLMMVTKTLLLIRGYLRNPLSRTISLKPFTNTLANSTNQLSTKCSILLSNTHLKRNKSTKTSTQTLTQSMKKDIQRTV